MSSPVRSLDTDLVRLSRKIVRRRIGGWLLITSTLAVVLGAYLVSRQSATVKDWSLLIGTFGSWPLILGLIVLSDVGDLKRKRRRLQAKLH